VVYLDPDLADESISANLAGINTSDHNNITNNTDIRQKNDYYTNTQQSHPRQASQTRSNPSIIAMLDSSRFVFQKWTPQPISVHADVGLEEGTKIILKMARVLNHPTRGDDAQTLEDAWTR
jgi:hypothetical protein